MNHLFNLFEFVSDGLWCCAVFEQFHVIGIFHFHFMDEHFSIVHDKSMCATEHAFSRDNFVVRAFLIPEAAPYLIEVDYCVLLNFGNADNVRHDYLIVSPISTSTW